MSPASRGTRDTPSKSPGQEVPREALEEGGRAFQKPGRGRPQKLTPELQDKILQTIRVGNYRDVAAATAGISRQTLLNWTTWGARYREGKGPDGSGKPRPTHRVFADFLGALEQAEAEGEVRDVVAVSQAVRGGNWKAAAWRLERKSPERWGRKDSLELSGNPERPFVITIQALREARKEIAKGDVIDV